MESQDPDFENTKCDQCHSYVWSADQIVGGICPTCIIGRKMRNEPLPGETLGSHGLDVKRRQLWLLSPLAVAMRARVQRRVDARALRSQEFWRREKEFSERILRSGVVAAPQSVEAKDLPEAPSWACQFAGDNSRLILSNGTIWEYRGNTGYRSDFLPPSGNGRGWTDITNMFR